MNVKELIEHLQKLPQDLEVLTASDDEGNSFRRVNFGWITVEKFSGMDLIAEEDYHAYDDLEDHVLIG